MMISTCLLAFSVVIEALPVVRNESVSLTWDAENADGPRCVLDDVAGHRTDLSPPWPAEGIESVRGEDVLGTWEGFRIQGPGGQALRVFLSKGSPFARVQLEWIHRGEGLLKIQDLVLGRIQYAASCESLTLVSPAGISKSSSPLDSYLYVAAGNPEDRRGILVGWGTQNKGSGIVRSDPVERGIVLTPRIEYGGRCLIRPGETFQSEILAVGVFEDLLDGLESYAGLMAEENGIVLPSKVPCGYCTWYHAGPSSERGMADTARFCQEHRLLDYGLECLQIDDGWQVGSRDFTTHKPQGPYAKGMVETQKTIQQAGLTSGIWLIPFGWDRNAPALKDHPDWFVHRLDGQIYDVYWAGDCLDMTHPEARAFLEQVVSRMTQEWGYQYLKIDGLWSGMAVKILYPEADYRPDGLGDAVFHDSAKTNVEAYRDGLRLVREAAGPGVYILGCNIAQNMRTLGASIGLVDGMRVGRDIGAKWDQIVPCAAMGSSLYFLHGRVWYNDPDCLMVREPLSLVQARACGTWIGVTGQMNLVSEWLGGLPAERLEIVKRTMPNHGRLARPLDLLERRIPSVWRLPIHQAGLEWDVVGLFNWDEKDALDIEISSEMLGRGSDTMVGFDFWENAFVPAWSGSIRTNLKPSSCKALAFRKISDLPQLVSTSRHVTQGAVDLLSVSWDSDRHTLTGTSQVVAGDPYELRLAVPEPWRLKRAKIAEASSKSEIKIVSQEAEARVSIESPDTQRITWVLSFKD